MNLLGLFCCALWASSLYAEDKKHKPTRPNFTETNRCSAYLSFVGDYGKPLNEQTLEEEFNFIQSLLSAPHSYSNTPFLRSLLERRLVYAPEVFYNDVQRLFSTIDAPYRPYAVSIYLESLTEILSSHVLSDSYRSIWKRDLEQIWRNELPKILTSIRARLRSHITLVANDPIYADQAQFAFRQNLSEQLDHSLYLQEFLMEEDWKLTEEERTRNVDYYQASKELEAAYGKFQELEKRLASAAGLVELLSPDETQRELWFHQGLIEVQALLWEIESATQNLEHQMTTSHEPVGVGGLQKMESLIRSIESAQNLLNGIYRTTAERVHDHFVWESLKKLAELASKLKAILAKHESFLGDSGSLFDSRIDEILQDDLTSWAKYIPQTTREEAEKISQVLFKIRESGYLESELPTEWKSDLSSFEAWRNLNSRLQRRGRISTDSSINAISFDRIRNHVRSIISIREKAEDSSIPSEAGRSEDKIQTKLLEFFNDLNASENRLVAALSDRRLNSGTRFILMKRLETLWRLRKFLVDQVRSIPPKASPAADSFERSFIDQIQAQPLLSKDFFLYMGAESLEEFERRQDFLKSIDYSSKELPLEVLERIGSETDFERFKASLTR